MVVLAKVAEMPEHDRATGKRLHIIIKASVSPLAETLGGIAGSPQNRPRTSTANEVAKPL
ncbi:MAG: hypothetical protein AUF79_09595 [Crenarchaeota archaeon 13_1_20CM_2_51_8]|nr:MAG: hypothetical protein AUF79_09595 [Crenarchaeota archaeon 13_1_20CM_2_51_8]